MKQGWEIKTIADVCTFIKNGANIKQERGAGGVPITRIETLSGGVFNRDRLGYANLATPDKYLSYVLEYGDLLFSHINSKTYIGRTVVYVPENDEQIIHGMNLLRLKLDFDLMSPFFFQYYTRTDKFRAQVANRRKDAVNQSSITTTDIKTISLPVPPIAEQEKIVAELDCLSGIIEKKKQQLKELDNLAQSIFYEMFGDPVENDKGWERLLFEKCIEKVRYTAKIATCNYATTGTFPIISQEEDYISGYWNNAEDVFMISKPVVIFGDHTRVLKYVDFDFVLGADGVKILQPIDTINAKFFLYYLIASKIPSLGYSRHYKLLKDLKVLLPPLSLQQDFASKIESIEKQKELIARSIKETETLFNSRMDYYFN